ncbi:uncharacterized protein C1orf50 homolog isoform X1 [Frieseomelitta varia]|uniref:uncharacterized protein C1orf50 homolog isoform X1 n=1 Tax=Frieseomelitta varia TaxID=561572 RepID=UPI001CB6934A|nr:uncharacterized protein C1orf50 homolog isoform X1 [Frieseomelitta varia]
MDNSKDLSTKAALVERNVQPQGILLNNPEAVGNVSQQDLIALATEIEKADNFVKLNACNKLQIIVDQIRYLKTQAENILTEADWNMKLHHVPCNFVKRPGHIYHLYQKETGQLYFSMISPQEWVASKLRVVQIYKGSYRLEHDQSWTPLEETDKKNKDTALLAELCSNIPRNISKSMDSM